MLRYQNNAFRILGVTRDATLREITQRVNEIEVRTSVGAQVSYDYDFPWMGEIDRSEINISNALQRLEDPISRLKEEIFWFWIDTNTDQKAFFCLIQGDRQAAHGIWKERTRYGQINEQTVSAFVNQMILSHSSVIKKEVAVKYGEEEEKCSGLSDTHWGNWKFTFNIMEFVTSSDTYWDRISKRAKSINDPRLSSVKVKEIRDHFAHDIAEPNFSFMSQALTIKDYERVTKHSKLLNESFLSPDALRKGFNRVLASQITLLNRHCKNSAEEMRAFEERENQSIETVVDIYTKLGNNVADAIEIGDMVDYNDVSDFALQKDNIAKQMRDMSVALNNILFSDEGMPSSKKKWGYKKAYVMIDKALHYVVSQYKREKFKEDEQALRLNMGDAYYDLTDDDFSSPEDVFSKKETFSRGVEASPKSYRPKQSRPKYRRPKYQRPKGKSLIKSLLSSGWFWIFAIFIMSAVIEEATTTPKTTSSTSSAGTSSSSRYSSNRSGLNNLKLRIEEIRRSTDNKAQRLESMGNEISLEENYLTELAGEINTLEALILSSNSRYGSIVSKYERKIDEYNERLEGYNQSISRYEELRNDYNNEINLGNRLVAEYNRKIR